MAERQRRYRTKMSDEAKARERERQRERRATLTDRARNLEQEAHMLRTRRARAAHTQEEIEARRRADRDRQRQTRTRINDSLSCYFYLGPMTTECQNCQALRFQGEPLNCCHNGKVSIPPLMHYPPALEELFTATSRQASNFREQIRKYNSAFSFASFGAQTITPPGRGTYCYRIHGQTYHSTTTLHPQEGEDRKYGQLYIIEGNQAVATRMNAAPNCDCLQDVMETIQSVIGESSPYADAFRYMHAVELSENQSAQTQPKEVKLFFKRGPDCRRYNEPSHDEVAAVFVGEDGAPPEKRDIVVYPKNRQPQRISYMSCHLDPMCYPLLFPRGDLGWHNGISHVSERQTSTRNRVTMQQFYSYRLAVHANFNPIHKSGKLFQQYAVDAYVKTEGCRLYFIRSNQKKLRVDLYSGLMDHLNTETEPGLKPGVPVVLPSSFNGSPRAMQQNYQDAMAIVAKYGKPDLFLTYTCNPKAQEITENLMPGERPEYRPDLISRVFKLHLVELLRDIKDRHVLGVPVARVHVIEFQKRGLPHCHMLIILRGEDKLRDRNDIDRMISAEIPDEEDDPELHALVKSFMIHGPCGVQNPNCVCMENGECRKKFPKDFRNETLENVNGYPSYRRRNDGRSVKVGNLVADNSYVVPYNSFLLRKYRAHINLEACASIKSVKYLFKYVYKGHDCANMELVVDGSNSSRASDACDEVSTYLNCRYVSAPEAVWRLSEYRLHEQSHTIIRLAIHLPQQQKVYFRDGEEEAAVERESSRNTHLTAWFKLNSEDSNARELLYTEVPKHYVFNINSKKWVKRQRGGDRIISRMYSVSPSEPEKFFLRMLLLHVPGACSYDDLKCVNGKVSTTFHDACIRLRLLADDTEYDEALAEASQFQMPKQLRSMFVTVCAYCQLTDPMQLWTDHADSLIEDFARKLSHECAVNAALHEIDQQLQENGLSCASVGLPSPQGEFNSFPEQPSTDISFDTLNEEQRCLAEAVLKSIEDVEAKLEPDTRCFYVDAAGGSGKTYVFNNLTAYLRSRNRMVACAAWTGIATTLMADARTLHGWFKLPVPILDTSTCNVSPSSRQAELLRNQSLFIIDEASMIPSHALHAIDRCLRDITGVATAFGGKILLLGGDFRQVLPVVPRVPPTVIIDTCIKRSPLWSLFAQYQLTTNMRTRPGEQEFAAWLLQLGNGTLRASNSSLQDIIEVPATCVVQQNSLIDEVYSSTRIEDMHSRVILTPKNDDCLDVNEKVLKMLPGEAKLYLSADSVKCDNKEESQNYPIEFLTSLTPSGMPPHKLNLKVNCIVMLLRNLSLKQGLCNGTRLRVTNLHQNCIQAEVLQGSNRGNKVLIPRVKLAPNDTNLPFTLERYQFPLRLAYSMTINKSQGQTFEKIGIYLPKPVFAHGQLYVAFSRARAMSDVKVDVHNTKTQGKKQGKTVTHNIVYREVLAKLSKSNHLPERQQMDARFIKLSDNSAPPPVDEAMSDEIADKCESPPQPSPIEIHPPGIEMMDTGKSPHHLLPVDEEVHKGESSSPHRPGDEHTDDSTFPINNGEIDDDVIYMPSTQPYICPFKYHPVDNEWQQRTCLTLGLQYCGSNEITPGGPDIPLTTPDRMIHVMGDGNCLFRAFSVIITGSENQHMSMRRVIVRHMRTIGDLIVRRADFIFQEHGIEHYIAENCMDNSGTWGTEVEIFALSHLLNVHIYVYLSQIHSGEWSRSTPRHVDVTQPQIDHSEMGIYMQLSHSHYEGVRSIKP